MKRSAGLFAVTLFFVFSAGCAAGGGDGKPQGRLATAELLILREDGSAETVLAEIARSGEQRNRGLMGRKSLPDGEGMLFVFETDRILSFWMKDTLIPLSIAFVAYDGRVLEIRDMEPRSLRSIQSSRSARYALEVPRGWFSRAGIEPGAVIQNLPK